MRLTYKFLILVLLHMVGSEIHETQTAKTFLVKLCGSTAVVSEKLLVPFRISLLKYNFYAAARYPVGR